MIRCFIGTLTALRGGVSVRLSVGRSVGRSVGGCADKNRWIIFSDAHGCGGDRPYFQSNNGQPNGFMGPWMPVSAGQGQLTVQPA